MYNQKNDPVAVASEVPPAQPAVVTEEPLPIIITAQPVLLDNNQPSLSSTVTEEPQVSATATKQPDPIMHVGKLIVDATACPQDISYPTDLNMLNDSREKAEELIDFLYNPTKHDKKR